MFHPVMAGVGSAVGVAVIAAAIFFYFRRHPWGDDNPESARKLLLATSGIRVFTCTLDLLGSFYFLFSAGSWWLFVLCFMVTAALFRLPLLKAAKQQFRFANSSYQAGAPGGGPAFTGWTCSTCRTEEITTVGRPYSTPLLLLVSGFRIIYIFFSVAWGVWRKDENGVVFFAASIAISAALGITTLALVYTNVALEVISNDIAANPRIARRPRSLSGASITTTGSGTSTAPSLRGLGTHPIQMVTTTPRVLTSPVKPHTLGEIYPPSKAGGPKSVVALPDPFEGLDDNSNDDDANTTYYIAGSTPWSTSAAVTVPGTQTNHLMQQQQPQPRQYTQPQNPIPGSPIGARPQSALKSVPASAHPTSTAHPTSAAAMQTSLAQPAPPRRNYYQYSGVGATSRIRDDDEDSLL